MRVRSLLIQHCLRPAFRAVFHSFFQIEFYGVENIPQTGPVILTPNHVAYLDPFWIGCGVPRVLHYMTWSEVFRYPYLRPMLWFFNCFPVDQDTPVDKSAFRRAQQLLADGEALMIFPEGGRCVSGTIDEFKAGAFRLAIRMQVPVVPVTLSGAHEVWPINRTLPRPGKLRVYFHEPQIFTATPKEVKVKSYEAAHLVRSKISTRLDPQRRPRDVALEPAAE